MKRKHFDVSATGRKVKVCLGLRWDGTSQTKVRRETTSVNRVKSSLTRGVGSSGPINSEGVPP